MMAAIPRTTTTGPRLGGSRFASCRRAPQRSRSRRASRFAARKLASGFFRSEPAPRARFAAAQLTSTHQENSVTVVTTVLGCAVAPNNTGVTGPVYGASSYGTLIRDGEPIMMAPVKAATQFIQYKDHGDFVTAYDPVTGAGWLARPEQGLQDMTPMFFGGASLLAPGRAVLPAGASQTTTQVVSVAAHGMRHFPAAARPAVEAAIKQDLATAGSVAPGQIIQRTITVGGEQVTYRGFGLPNGTVNVGTAFPGTAVRNIAQ